MSVIVLEEYELMKDSKYRAYMSAVDKALRSFEYTSEWADLISALGKLNKVLLANMKFPVIPRRIKISKRLAQCMHPVLPSGVHLKALETYDIIFKCMGTSRLSHELFIYSAGLFPLLGHSAMIVRPSLLTVYETHFVPLGERLTPALSGFLSGVLPGLEEGSDHFDRTNLLLEKVCDGVGKAIFYGCLWECLASNAAIRLPGVGFALSHFNKKLSMEDQLYVMGTNVDTMVIALCASVQDSSVLVQRSTLDLLLAGLPMHNSQLVRSDMTQLVTAALTTILRRDMSLNRRLFAWLLGTEVGSGTSELRRTLSLEGNSYFDLYSRDLLVQAIKRILSQGQAQPQTPDLRPYKLLVSLLDKPDIGPVILDDILHEVFRTLYLSCEGARDKDGTRKGSASLTSSMYRGSQELLKTANLLFSALEPSYVWQFAGTLFENACRSASDTKEEEITDHGPVRSVDSGTPDIVEVCTLTQFLLDMVSLDTYADTPTEHLPGLFLRVLIALTKHCSQLTAIELASSLQLCRRVLVRVQPGNWGPSISSINGDEDERNSHISLGSEVRESDDATVPVNEHSELLTESSLSINDNNLVSSGSNSSDTKLIDAEIDKITLTDENNATAVPVFLDTENTLDLTEPVSIDSDSSSASLLMDSNPLESQLDSKSTGSTKAETSLPEELSEWTQKASELQNLVDTTISLNLGTEDTDSNLSNSTTLPFYESINSQNSIESSQELKDSKNILWISKEKVDAIPIHSPVSPKIKVNDKSINSSSLKIHTNLKSDGTTSLGEKSSRQQSVMSECLLQFQELFVRLVSKRILSTDTDITAALNHLLSIPPRDSTEHRTRELENKLKECLGHVENEKQHNKSGKLSLQKSNLVVPGSEWPQLQECLSQACRLLVELSTFPTLCTPGRTPTADREPVTFGEVPRRFPQWLQTLLVLCAGLDSKQASSLQLLAASTFLSLLDLLREVPTQQEPHQGVIAVVIIPLLTPAQVAFIEGYTAVFQTMARLLWDQLGAPCPSNHLQCAQLLLRLHNALPSSDVVEDVIGGSLTPDPQAEHDVTGCQEDSQKIAEAFERFTTLWHLSREPSDLQVSQCRALDKSLFKMLDNLKRPPGPLQLQTQGWLLQALLRGDTARILEPLLLILLSPGTARLGVRHANVSHSSTVLAKNGSTVDTNESNSSATRIFAISSQDGHVIYHVSDSNNSRSSNPVQARRIYAVTKLATGSKEVGHCITEGAFLRAAEQEENQKMSLIVNPMSLSEVETESDSGQSWSQGEEPASQSSSSEWSKESTEQKEQKNLERVEGVLQEILDAVVLQDNVIEASSTSTTVHALHSHMLLYAQVYDAHRTLYALGAVRSLLLTSPRIFLCSTASTGLAHGSSRGAALVSLLARHAQSAQGGRSFEGELGGEWMAAARSSMFLEALVSSLLWFTRSYYPNLGQARLTNTELSANRQVQLASAELLTLLLAELALLARDGGRGLAQYLADLLQRCRLPQLALGLLLASVHAARAGVKSSKEPMCFTEEILQFNHETVGKVTSCPQRLPAHVEASQVQLLRLVLALVMLEEQALRQTRDTADSNASSTAGNTPANTPNSPADKNTHQLRYISGCPVPQQPVFLAAVMSALKLEHMSHLHQSWTVMLASALPFMGSALAHVVLNVSSQLCTNLERLATLYRKGADGLTSQCCLPAQYAATQLEALATLIHYCLLDSAQQLAHSMGQPLTSTVSTIQDAIAGRDKSGQAGAETLLEARRLVLSSLPRIMSCAASLWQAIGQAGESEGSVLGSPRSVRQQLVHFLSPIALHHSTNFLAAVAVVAASDFMGQTTKVTPECTEQQKVLVSLISSIRVLPLDTLVQTVLAVVRQPPPLVGATQGQSLEVSLLEFFSCYLQKVTSKLTESWGSLLSLLRECVSLPPPTPFIALALLSNLLHRAVPPSAEKRDTRSVQDVTSKLVETCAQLAGACLEQTTWLRRNLAVREDMATSPEPQATTPSPTSTLPKNDAIGASFRYSLQAQNVLAELLAPLLDVAFGSQDKERVVTLLTAVLANVTPYLRNHSVRNAQSFRACSQLLASVSGYQYTRRAWKKEALELLLDPALFQMEPQCLNCWKNIVDNLMAHDAATFRDLLARVSVPQGGSLSLFSSKEQELEQRAQLLKRLAFVLLCGETDQYQKHMHEIQERLADCLRLPQAVPTLQAQVFLCFRVLLIRMSPHHVTSLWPVVISELVQAMLHMEHQLNTRTEQFRAHLRLLSGLDAAWALDSSNGLQATGHPAWLALQLAACKLLDLMLALPASRLPQFTMYRWAFVGDYDNESSSDTPNGEMSSEEREDRELTPTRSPDFVPHVTRLSRLLDTQASSNGTMPPMITSPGQPLLHMTSIQSLQQLQGFFTALSHGTRPTVDAASSEWEQAGGLQPLEEVLEMDFLEPLPSK